MEYDSEYRTRSDLLLDMANTNNHRGNIEFDSNTGELKRFYKFRMWENNDTPLYSATGDLKARGSVQEAGDQKASVFFYSPNTVYHLEKLTILYKPMEQDTRNADPTSEIRLHGYGLCDKSKITDSEQSFQITHKYQKYNEKYKVYSRALLRYATDRDSVIYPELLENSIRWKNPGYHFIIKADGEIVSLLPIEQVSNGVQGFNSVSVNICYIGDRSFRKAQRYQNPGAKQSLLSKLKELKRSFQMLSFRDIGIFQMLRRPAPRLMQNRI